MLLILVGFSCQSTKKTSAVTSESEALVYYSKSPCRGKCPVYDVWIYEDGSIFYSGISNTTNGNVKSKLEKQELQELKAMLKQGVYEDLNFKKVLDRPITTLRFNGKEYKYYSSKIDGEIKQLDIKLKNTVDKIIMSSMNDRNKEG